MLYSICNKCETKIHLTLHAYAHFKHVQVLCKTKNNNIFWSSSVLYTFFLMFFRFVSLKRWVKDEVCTEICNSLVLSLLNLCTHCCCCLARQLLFCFVLQFACSLALLLSRQEAEAGLVSPLNCILKSMNCTKIVRRGNDDKHNAL